MLDPLRRDELERDFVALLLRHGARAEGLAEAVHHALNSAEQAFAATASDGSSLSVLDVLRIRAGKFAAARLPPTVFRDPAQLAELRRAIHALSVRALASEDARGSRF
jgi:hypothetical protein